MFAVGRPDLTDVFQRFLDVVGYCQHVGLQRYGGALLDFSAAEEQAEGHRHAPEARQRHTPVVDQEHHRDNCCGNVCAVEIAEAVGPDVLQAVDVPHERFGQIGKIAFPEISERQTAKPLRKRDARVLDLPVNQPVGVVILLQVRDKRENHKRGDQHEKDPGFR